MDTDVIVVGAGPTGLMLAGELRLGGARVIVLERLTEPTGQSRGLGFTTRARESFEQRGLLPRFGEVTSSPQGHFGGMQFDYAVLPGADFGARGIPQSRTEAVLENWALELGAEVRRGVEFLDAVDLGDSVEVTVSTKDGVRRMSAGYLVGCGGGHSPVRKAVGFDFPGSAPSRGMYLADVSGCRIRPRFLGERLPGGMVMAAPIGPDTHRIILVEDGAPPAERGRVPDFVDLAAAWQRLTGEDISSGRADWVGTFSDANRQVIEYRRGRVLLAGDAAHVHLPAGGQGLSTGVQDAVNLGWKLAATVRGWAPEGLLDSYHSERHPVGARLLMNTAAQGMLFVGPPQFDPLRELFGELMNYEDVRRHLAGVVSGVDIRYDVGDGDNPLLGRRLPPRRLVGGAPAATTAELLHPARGLLLDLGDDPLLREAVAPWADRLDVVTTRPEAEGPDDAFASSVALLVRPDGYIAWTDSDRDRLETALTRWFGAPAAPGVAGVGGAPAAVGAGTGVASEGR
ncbi:FAD-dependent monooxygenase [Streptacidiphilus jiangxiensis]|uniref:Bifunctional hydroxylase/dehydrase n=1 Tax=Streptacidiphilus jiangxiensis TaxID=235985 RepID=A0A1H7KJK8_STRJI|nr:FAD-dependent monooxygenase [Streptacidiphilus jiangxiensis]SEK86696.1 bifunctional hydroxylase/dehydrase [Streptacidiphilus jiangxiensis]